MLCLRKPQILGAVGAIMFGGPVAQAISLDLGNTDSIKSAASTVAHGMMNFYKGNETGMTVGLLPDPYYWWEAGAMFGELIEYWYYTGDTTYNDVTMAGLLAQTGPNNDYMPDNQTKTEGNDDQDFWAFAAMSAAELNFPAPPAKSPSWLALAQAVFNLQVDRWDTTSCGGGLRWQIFAFNKGYDYKNSISNGGFFQLAARLARYTGNDTYAQWADKSYEWILTTPLFTSDYLIYDGSQIEQNCTTASKLQWTYNVGTFLMGAANMYNYTNGDPKWRTRVEGLLNGSQAFFPAQSGGNIMVEIACEPQGTCNYDQPSFKAYLSRWMAATTQLAPFSATFINPKLHDSAQGAAQQCSGGADGVTCGRTWHSATWDGKTGVGEQMSALSVIQANLISKVAGPVTAAKGGTSKGNPSAGTQGDNPNQVLDPSVTSTISAGDKAGAGILTALRLRALFPKGNKAVTFTTSPNKKRKLSPSDPAEVLPNTQETTSPPELVLLDQAANPASSPPRFIPPHLILEGARNGRSPTPEPPNTAASSPSAAYAGLNIDSDGSGYGSGPDTSTGRRRSSLANVCLLGGAASHRAASPAKRKALAMGGVSEVKVVDDVVMGEEPESQPAGTPGPSDGSELPSNVLRQRRKSKSQGTRHKREKSVDMIVQDADKSTYQTPHSGASSVGSTFTGEAPAGSEIPTIDDQIRQVTQLAQQESMKEGQKGYIVASKWLSRVLARGSDAVGSDKYGKGAREGVIGPVDNSGLDMVVDPATGGFKDEKGETFIPLRPGLQLNDDFEILPEAAWNLIIKWYRLTTGSPIITRYCHNTSISEIQDNFQYELYPPVFTILKLPDTSAGLSMKVLKEKDATPVKMLASRHEGYQTFLKRAKTYADIDLKTKVRVWRILDGLGGSSQSGMMTPAQSRSSSPAPGAIIPVDPGNKLVLDVNTFAGLQLGSQRELIEAKDETANEKYNGHSNLDIVGLRQDGVIVLEEQIGGPAGGEWVSDAATSKAKTNGVPVSITKSGATVTQNSLKPNGNVNSRGSSPAPGGIMTRGRQAKNGRTRGTIGLNNLGNTCYMNSALQCVRSVEELTVYFLENKYKKELNPRNPLSHNGEVAKAYAKLLHDMYSPDCTQSFAPRQFKNIIGKYGPSFSGYQQQDSQEFLLFLLDGLQEDLNRIDKKPYIEKPDSTDEMVNDFVALREMADKCWDIYKKRNDSVVTDLFAGMYKSTVVCPVCDKVSIIFDPFNNLTLQLPIENMWSRTIFFFPAHSRPVLVSVDIDKSASFMSLKKCVADKFPGADPNKFIVAEIYKNKFYKVFDDKSSINEENIAENDHIAILELDDQPTNWPAPKKTTPKKPYPMYSVAEEVDIPRGDSPLADKMMVSVFNQRSREGSSRNQSKTLFGAPSLIIVTREEARDFDSILRKVLAKVTTLTTRDFLREGETPSNDSAMDDSDPVLMNADDAETDEKVHAESLESEDGMVDISMKDHGDKAASQSDRSVPNQDTKPMPPMLQPDGYITPGVRDLFDMKYISTSNEMVPLGWTSFNEDRREFPLLSSRQKVHETSKPGHNMNAMDESNSRLDKGGGSPSSSDEDLDDPLQVVQNSTEDYASDSENGLPAVEQLYNMPAPPRKDQRTYSRKGKQSAAATDDRPLIRLGEALVLDWTAEAYDALFSGTEGQEEEEMRGAPTYDNIPTHPDPELELKRRTRASRRRNGISLDDCLDEFGKSETLSENDAWYCPRCKEHRRASKKFELWKAPDILVIHLKRFSAQGRFRDKLDVLVDFPIEGLDLSSRVAIQEEKSPIYDLFAVDNHYGGLGGGHYTAFAQNFLDKSWYEYNDSSVSKKSNPEKVVTPAAYLLFYRRRSATPLGGPFFEQMIAAANDTPSESQPTSRAVSPAGEGKRLDDSSRNGSSSALVGVGAAHQAGGGGSAAGRTQTRTGVDDGLPAYQTVDPQRLQSTSLENMELDQEEDEAIGDMHDVSNRYNPVQNRMLGAQGQWNWDNLAVPPASEHDADSLLAESELLEAAESVKHGSTYSDNERDRMADFDDDQGTTHGAFGTPPPDAVPLEVPPSLGNYDEPVVDVSLPDEADELGMD